MSFLSTRIAFSCGCFAGAGTECLEEDVTFEHISKLNQGRIFTYRHWGLPVQEIGNRVKSNQVTMKQICNRWMQEKMTNEQYRLHQLRRTTKREDRYIERMTRMDHSVTARITS
ncbi:hypothetical protein TNCV_1132031 [Trichonephila clavipes]|nr:hypothetical protein TNCV_1132031 [Trichonephila clavipes]